MADATPSFTSSPRFRGLIGVITSLKGTGSDGQDNAEAVAKFGRFFMGGLWDSYVAHRPS